MIIRLTEAQVKSVADEVVKVMKMYGEEYDSQDENRFEEGFVPLTPEIMWYNENMTEEDIFEVGAFDLGFCQEKVENSMDDICIALNKLLTTEK